MAVHVVFDNRRDVSIEPGGRDLFSLNTEVLNAWYYPSRPTWYSAAVIWGLGKKLGVISIGWDDHLTAEAQVWGFNKTRLKWLRLRKVSIGIET